MDGNYEVSTMFGFLPPPVEDELFYGLMARYATYLGKQRSSRMVQHLTSSRFTADVPNVARFAQRPIAAGWLPEPSRLLESMTTFPYYEHGLSAQRALQCRSALLKVAEAGHKSQVSFRRRAPQTLRWCPECARQDRSECGLGTWRRVHQLPDVYVCPQHGCALLDSRIAMLAQESLLVCPEEPSCCERLPCPYPPEVALRLAQSSAWLLQRVPAGISRSRVPALLGRMLEGRPWFVDGLLRKWPLAEAMVAHFGRAALDQDGECFYLAKTVRTLRPSLKKRGCINPSRLLLLLELCGHTAQTFFAEEDRAEDGDWVSRVYARGCPPTQVLFMPDRHLKLARLQDRAHEPEGGRHRRELETQHVQPKSRWGFSEGKDLWWAKAVTGAAARVRLLEPPDRVCMSSMQRCLAEPDELRHRMLAPLTRAAVLATVESREDYLLRQLDWLHRWLTARGEWLSLTDFLRQVGCNLPPAVRARAIEAHEALPKARSSVRYRSRSELRALCCETRNVLEAARSEAA